MIKVAPVVTSRFHTNYIGRVVSRSSLLLKQLRGLNIVMRVNRTMVVVLLHLTCMVMMRYLHMLVDSTGSQCIVTN